MRYLDPKTRAMRDKIAAWKVKVGRFDVKFRDDTPQEIRDLEVEYRKRIAKIEMGTLVE